MKKNYYRKIKIFADGANFNEMINLSRTNFIKGLTTNPSLMKKNSIKINKFIIVMYIFISKP